MSPLSDGDRVIVHKQENFISGQTCILILNGEEATVKDVIRTDKGIMLIPRNQTYETIEYTHEEIKNMPIKIIGVVVEARIKGMFK